MGYTAEVVANRPAGTSLRSRVLAASAVCATVGLVAFSAVSNPQGGAWMSKQGNDSNASLTADMKNATDVGTVATGGAGLMASAIFASDGNDTELSSTEKSKKHSKPEVPAKLSNLAKVGKDFWQGVPFSGKAINGYFEKPKNPKLSIDLDPDADPSMEASFEKAGIKGYGCHKFSFNDGNANIGETKTPTGKMTSLKVTKAFPGGASDKMMLFENQYCDIPRGNMPSVDTKGHDGSGCYRSEWTLAHGCRADYIPVRGELWFGFSLFIPAKVGKGLKYDTKFLEVVPGTEQDKSGAPKVTKATYRKPIGGQGAWDTNAYSTEHSNWLDIFQIHHGGYGAHTIGTPTSGLEGREPLIALTLMNGEYYTLMLSGSDEKTGTTTTIEKIVDANLGQWENFVYHTVMSPDKKVGVAQLWRNGEMIADRKGISTQYHTDDNPPFPKFGVYADTWKYHRHEYANKDLTVGFGKFKMGGAKASYDDVCIDQCEKGNSHKSEAPAAAASAAAPAALAAPAAPVAPAAAAPAATEAPAAAATSVAAEIPVPALSPPSTVGSTQ